MRNFSLIILALILTQSTCSPDNNDHDYLSLLYGKWALYQRINITVVLNYVRSDTTYFSNQFLQFDITDYCKRITIKNDSTINSFSYAWGFIKPDSIWICSCSQENIEICEIVWWIYYRIEELNKNSMILKTQWDTIDIDTRKKIGDKFEFDYYYHVPE